MKFTQGNLLDARVDTLVNNFNTVGVLGQGIAMMLKERFKGNYQAIALPPVTREFRADHARVYINSKFTTNHQAFLNFVLSHYVSVGVEKLDQNKLTPLLLLKCQDSIADAVADLGKPEEINMVFAGFQKYLYQTVA